MDTKPIKLTKLQVSRSCSTQCPLCDESSDRVRRCHVLFCIQETRMMDAIKKFSCPPLCGDSTVLGVDKTFNLGIVHAITLTNVYECRSVKRKRTDDFLVFCGPMFLHGNSDRETFFLFFQHIPEKLGGCAQCPVLGSGEEKALCQAMSLAFPKSPRLACSQHVKKSLQTN
ncbi:hypothetical protein ElyMa_000098600 [Elysia marginata]|uniref:MULE transposase domain-containing protein n=1 Tax=Elysia marginata TaxID=1093978 RepID=A0AAV4EJE9_9GAST|nr:hypothetical protein ElyMa_000098600 [Elysia marginata]